MTAVRLYLPKHYPAECYSPERYPSKFYSSKQWEKLLALQADIERLWQDVHQLKNSDLYSKDG